MSCWAKKYRR